MKKIASLIAFMSIGILSITAQIGSIPDYEAFMRELETTKMKVTGSESLYEGSPYLFEVEESASVYHDGKEVVKNLTMRYNAYKDQVEVKKEDQYYVVPKEDIFSEIQLGEFNIVLKTYISTSKKKLGYFLSEAKGKLNLYSQHRVILNEPEEPGAFKEAKPAEFVKKQPVSFILCEDNVLRGVKNKNNFLDLVPDHQKELATFIKKNKIKFRKPESVKQLVEYYNSL
ncbi:MAG: hypothetical protein MI866_17980 [Bacteroidales bacterium]|nr:hypothetical protein [Bacteroidales bacterium]